MPESKLLKQLDRWRRAWNYTSTAVILLVLLVTLFVIKPGAPDKVVLLTGAEHSSYHNLGLQYAADLRRRGLDAEVVATEGAFDNIQRLAAGGTAVGFAPSTIGAPNDSGVDTSHLVALANVRLEPLWLFYRSDLQADRISDLTGRKVVSEGVGTVSEQLGRLLIAKNGLTNKVDFRPLESRVAKTLLDGFSSQTIDAGFVTGEVTAPVVDKLLKSDGVQFLSFQRAKAYSGLLPGVTEIVVPEGAIDLARNVPPNDAQLLACTTCVIAHEEVHPTVVAMLLSTAEEVREQRTTFATDVTFPSEEHVTLPLDPAARRYFRQGETGLSKFLPYKVTRFLNHLGFFVLPVMTVTVMLLKSASIGMRVWGQWRLKQSFKQLETIEKSHVAGDDVSRLLAELDQIDEATATMFVPRSSVQDYVDFRQFLHDMRERVRK